MKKNIIMAMIAAIVSMSMSANSYFTMGDSLRIPPRYSDGYFKADVTANFDAYCDTWQLNMGYPDGLMVKLVSGITALEGMQLEYMDYTGAWQEYEAPLQVAAAYASISSHITAFGFWDYNEDGILESYGSAKWEAGQHKMFQLNFYVSPDFSNGYVTIDGSISSGSDSRGPILQNVQCFKKTYVWVGYLPGDMNGDDRLTISDVTLLISFIMSEGAGFDRWQADAADYNRNGIANITDVTALIAHILNDNN